MSRQELALALKTRVGYFQVTPIFVPLMGLRSALAMGHEVYKKQVFEITIVDKWRGWISLEIMGFESISPIDFIIWERIEY